jgi:hypothetical protein
MKVLTRDVLDCSAVCVSVSNEGEAGRLFEGNYRGMFLLRMYDYTDPENSSACVISQDNLLDLMASLTAYVEELTKEG